MAKSNVVIPMHDSIDDAVKDDTAIIATIKTGLMGKDQAIMKRLPVEYSEKSLADTIRYILDTEERSEYLSSAESIRKELKSPGCILVINNKSGNLIDTTKEYLTTLERTLPTGETVPYKNLEIDVSAVQQGGSYLFKKLF